MFKKHLIFSIAVIFLISGCQTAQQTNKSLNKTARPESSKALTDRERSELYHTILAAELAQGNKDINTALTQYLYALSIMPDAKIAAEAIVLAQKAQDSAALIQASEAWLEVEPKNQEALQANILGYLMQADGSQYLQLESMESAYLGVQKVLESSNNATEAFQQLSGITRLYLFNSTLSLWQQLVRDNAEQAIAWTLLADSQFRAASVARDTSFLQKAEQALDAALRRDATFEPAVSLKVQLLRAQHKDEQVSVFLETLLVENKENTAAYAALAQDYYRNRLYQQAIALIQSWQTLEPDNNEASYLLAASYYGLRDFKRSNQEFLKLVTRGYNPELSFYYCGDTAERSEQFNQAIACYKQVESGKYWFAAQRQLSYLLIHQGREKEALSRLETIALNAPQAQSEEAVVLRGDLLMRLDRHLEAVEWLSRFINSNVESLLVPVKHLEVLYFINPDDNWNDYADKIAERLKPDLRTSWYLEAANTLSDESAHSKGIDLLSHAITHYPENIELLYSRALMREPLEQFSAMEKELRYVYSLAPENPHVQNALGFTLADMNKDLNFALDLIQKAQKALPRSAAVIDSLGWVYYRLGKLNEAEELLSQAINQESTPEVAAHLIEVLAENNKAQQATEMFQKYKERFPENKFLIRLNQKYQLETNK